MAAPDLDDLAEAIYPIVLAAARSRRGIITYGTLCQRLPNPWVDLAPHDPRLGQALGLIGRRLRAVDLPWLTAVVVGQERQEPGKGFFDDAFPKLPAAERTRVWIDELARVKAAAFPEALRDICP
ncbi:MAG: hypothetical protein H6706_17720 [Myxococcales bacterium]|nr:hypothetical protein [Myxococcales bacterium]